MHKIGQKIQGDQPVIFELDIKSLVPSVDPNSFGIKIAGIDPQDYYITSGDAIQKAISLEKDIKSHLLELSTMIKKSPKNKKLLKYQIEIKRMLSQTKRLIKNLITARGDKKFLETEWDSHVLYVTPKNPRTSQT